MLDWYRRRIWQNLLNSMLISDFLTVRPLLLLIERRRDRGTFDREASSLDKKNLTCVGENVQKHMKKRHSNRTLFKSECWHLFLRQRKKRKNGKRKRQKAPFFPEWSAVSVIHQRRRKDGGEEGNKICVKWW